MVTLKLSNAALSGSRKSISKWFSAPKRFDIPGNGIHPLRVRTPDQWLRVISGVAWISYEGSAAVLRDGETLHLTPEMGQIVISAEGDIPLSFELQRGE